MYITLLDLQITSVPEYLFCCRSSFYSSIINPLFTFQVCRFDSNELISVRYDKYKLRPFLSFYFVSEAF